MNWLYIFTLMLSSCGIAIGIISYQGTSFEYIVVFKLAISMWTHSRERSSISLRFLLVDGAWSGQGKHGIFFQCVHGFSRPYLAQRVTHFIIRIFNVYMDSVGLYAIWRNGSHTSLFVGSAKHKIGRASCRERVS